MLLVSFLSSLNLRLHSSVSRLRNPSGRSRRSAAVFGAESLETRTLLAVNIIATNTDSLSNDVDGDGVADPGDTLQHTITIDNSGTTNATGVSLSDNEDAHTTLVGGSVKVTPIAFDDAYALTGNTPITINAAAGVLANDIDPDSSTPLSNVGLAAVSLNTTGTAGSVTLNANGSFTYTPATGVTGTDTFQYTARDADSLDSIVTGTVTMTISGMVWYVDSSAPAGGADGSFDHPLTSLTPINGAGGAGDVDAPGHTIFVYESGSNYVTGLELENSQILIGESTGLTVNGMTIGGSGTAPTISRATGSTIALASGNNLRGLKITNSNGSGITGSAVGTLLLADFDVTVTNGTALSVTTSGTITATGSNNDLSATTGVGLNVANVTIGAAGLTLKSIAASGAANGIVLNNTGTGAFTITGDGADNTVGGNFSGGTISTTTTGISLTSVSNVSLNRIRITGTTEDGLFGNGVNNFTFANSRVINIGDDVSPGDTDTGLQFVNLTGTAVIKRSIIGPDSGYALNDNPPGDENDGIQIDNLNQSLLTMTVTGSQFTNISNDGIDARGQNSDITLTVDGSTGDGANAFTGINGRSVLLEDNNDLANNSNFNLTVNNNTFTNVGNGAVWLVHAGSTVVASFNNNTMSGTRDDAIRSLINPGAQASGFSATTVDATIRGNDMGGGAVFMASRREGVSTVRLGGAAVGQGNTNIRGASGALNNGLSHPDPVFLEASRGGVLNIDVLQNSMTSDSNGPEFSFATMSLQTVAGGFANTAILANIASNNITLENAAANFLDAIWFDIDAGTTISLENFGGGGNAAAATFLNGQNTITPALDPDTNATWSGTVTPGGNAVPLLFGGSGVTAPTPSSVAARVTTIPASPTISNSSPVAPNPTTLTSSALSGIVSAAMARWSAAGLSDAQLAVMRSTEFRISDMAGWYLGMASTGLVQIDINAGGFGWFIDSTPLDDIEFGNSLSDTRLYTSPSGAPAGRIDLLTTVMHELGHQLGVDDSYLLADENSLMYGFATLGERRLPAAGQAIGAIAGPIEHEEYLIGPIALGTLPAGKSVAVTFNVTIIPLSNGLAPTLSNQGTVSGSNFASVLTDDPAGGGSADSTTTTLDSLTLGNQIWIDADSNIVFNSGTDIGAGSVAVTLFLSNGTTVVTTDSSNGSGVYQFTGLLPGDYIVRVDASNFGAGQTLEGKVSVTGGVDPDDNVNNDDNGVDDTAPVTNGIRSLPITLAYNTEVSAGVGNDTNNRLDLGFSLLPAPVITAPSAITPYQRPTITWNAVSGADRYQLWIKNQTTNVNPFLQATRTSTAFYPASDLGIGLYNLWMRSGNTSGQFSAYTPQYNFRITTRVIFNVVNTNQTTQTPTLTWVALTGATKYDLWINNLSTGQLQVVRDPNLTATSWTSPTNLPMGSYRAWVRGLDASGFPADWSTAVDFNVLPTVTALGPVGSTFDRTPTFIWTGVSGAAGYDIVLRNANTGAIVNNPTNIVGTTYTQPTNLPVGPYRWQVLAVSSTGLRSQLATTQNIFVGGRPTLLTPTGSTSDTTPTFNWTAVNGVGTYELYVTRTDILTGGIINQIGLVGTTYTPVTPLPTGTYRAWVRAVSSTAQVSPWSLQVDFTISAVAEEPGFSPGSALLAELETLESHLVQASVDRVFQSTTRSAESPEESAWSVEFVSPLDSQAIRVHPAAQQLQPQIRNSQMLLNRSLLVTEVSDAILDAVMAELTL